MSRGIGQAGLSSTLSPRRRNVHTDDASPRQRRVLTTPIYLPHSGSAPFRPSTVPHIVGSFQLTSRLLCRLLTALRRSANLAACSLRAVALLSCPRKNGLRTCSATCPSCRGIGKPVASLSGISLAEPGALPGYCRLLSMRNRRVYVKRLRGNWRTSDCVAPSSWPATITLPW